MADAMTKLSSTKREVVVYKETLEHAYLDMETMETDLNTHV